MKPNQQFINTIAMLYQSRQPAVTNLDLIRHTNGATAFYAITKMTLRNNRVVSQTEAFGDRTIIEIGRGANTFSVTVEGLTTNYNRTTPLEYLDIHGKGHVLWNATNSRGEVFVVVKLMSPDGNVQLKLITADEVTQIIYNVCELPSHINPMSM